MKRFALMLAMLLIASLFVHGCTIGHASTSKPDGQPKNINGHWFLYFREGSEFAWTHDPDCTHPKHTCCCDTVAYTKQTLTDTEKP